MLEMSFWIENEMALPESQSLQTQLGMKEANSDQQVCTAVRFLYCLRKAGK